MASPTIFPCGYWTSQHGQRRAFVHDGANDQQDGHPDGRPRLLRSHLRLPVLARQSNHKLFLSPSSFFVSTVNISFLESSTFISGCRPPLSVIHILLPYTDPSHSTLMAYACTYLCSCVHLRGCSLIPIHQRILNPSSLLAISTPT